ncbi:MAG: hypothetical protein JRN73_08750 [Nitrososphaerota archaeon]|nr:hypothetical protein [Nitrososphaerota archaeon]MDG7018423.1 hypothetical protein [Nitrososphaerota archaeon]
MTFDPVNTTQTTYQSESLGQLSYCPAPDRYTGSCYSCSQVYRQQTATTSLGQLSYCPTGSSATQYSCSAVYSAYTYWVTETVPVVTAVTYETLSTLGSAWLIGG